MIVKTTRFGEINIDESRVIEMRGGILGFDHLRRYILIVQDEKTPFCWLQSLEDGDVAFVVINPFIVKPDYEPVVSDGDIERLEIERAEDVVLLSIVTIRSEPFAVSANLRAPLVVNVKKMAAKQVILEDPVHPIHYYVETTRSVQRKDQKDYDMTRIGHAVAL